MLNRKLVLFSLLSLSTLFFIAANQYDRSEDLPDRIPTAINQSKTDLSEDKKANAIQLALLLDTSQSMDGLIEQAKSQLWNILNTLSLFERNNEETELQIALYEYGNPDRCKNKIFVSKLSDFTTDVDLISEKLFSLSTEGGEEFCASAIKSSLESLEWTNGCLLYTSPSPRDQRGSRMPSSA